MRTLLFRFFFDPDDPRRRAARERFDDASERVRNEAADLSGKADELRHDKRAAAEELEAITQLVRGIRGMGGHRDQSRERHQ